MITAKCEDRTRSRLLKWSLTAHRKNPTQTQGKGSKCPTNKIGYDITNIPDHFTVEVRNRFLQLLQVDERESKHQMSYEKASEVKKHISCKRKRKQPRISQFTLDLAGRRKKAKAVTKWNDLA